MIEISGILRHVSNIETITYGDKSCKKRSIVIELVNAIYLDKFSIDFYGDKCELLNDCSLDLPITVRLVPQKRNIKKKSCTLLKTSDFFCQLSGEALNNVFNKEKKQ